MQSRYYNPEVGRFLNADALVATGQGTLGNNMLAYCLNNPIALVDSSGLIPQKYTEVIYDGSSGDYGPIGGLYHLQDNTYIIKKISKLFGAGVIKSNSYESFSMDTLFGGVEHGVSTSSTILGDVSKPVSVYATNASEWWKITEYKVGVQFNVGSGGVSFASGAGESSLSFSIGNGTTLEFISGIDKIGVTISEGADFGRHTAERYCHAYIRSIPTAGLLLALIYAPECVSALIPAVAVG